MRRNERFAVVLLLAYVFTISFCSAGTAGSEPNVADLVQAVRESENWLHRIDSFQLRIEGKWSRPPESIAARYAELKKQSPDQEPDPNRSWDLKPSESDILEYTIDFKGKRLRYVKDTPGRSYFLGIWDGKQAMRYSERGGRHQQYDIESSTKMFETIFGSLSWPRAQPHSFWWEPQNIEEKIDHFGRAEDFKIIGRDEYRGVVCHILECMSRSDPRVTYRWYVGVEDHLLYGRQDWIKPEFVYEYWTLDYKQIAPGYLLPMTQGYSLPEYNPDTKQHYIVVVRDVRVIEVRVNNKLPDELFQMKFEEGLYVADRRSGKTVVYKYIAIPPSLIDKPLPNFKNIKIDFNNQQTEGKMFLVCFWDMNQRPSRNCITRLAKQAKQLKEKGLAVVAVYASKVDENKLDNWMEKYDVPFLAGVIEGDEEEIRMAWGIKSLPWLILTDRRHIVTAEGFGVDELDNKI
jgi:hypothetical protein